MSLYPCCQDRNSFCNPTSADQYVRMELNFSDEMLIWKCLDTAPDLWRHNQNRVYIFTKSPILAVGIEVELLNLFNAQLSPKMCRRGPRSQQVGEEGDYANRYTITTRMTPAFRWAATRAILMFR